uniref:Uncharacterized protein n=1 Tax=Anguilla anguilla TaxID=7936 RepID=A0A0E9XUA2_ANGAN
MASTYVTAKFPSICPVTLYPPVIVFSLECLKM